jgi:hypothetical protein
MSKPNAPDCFADNTKIMTLRGEIPIEQVVVGDRVVTLTGIGATLKPITWIGRVEVDLDTHPDPLTAAPIRICAGAIDDGMPIRDLRVSPDHGISLEDDTGRRVLVSAVCLVNGATIVRDPPKGRVTYYAIELEEHDVLMADGMACETYLENADRALFGTIVVPFPTKGKAGKPAKLPEPEPPDFSPRQRPRKGCYHMLSKEGSVPLHKRCLARAQEELGWRLTDDPAMSVMTDQGPAEFVSDTDGEFLFLLPPNADRATVTTRMHIPAETDLDNGDPRTLGISLRRLIHDGEEIALDDDALVSGFLPRERDGANVWRWTIGPAELDLQPRDTETTLELHVNAGWSRFWVAPIPPEGEAAAG